MDPNSINLVLHRIPWTLSMECLPLLVFHHRSTFHGILCLNTRQSSMELSFFGNSVEICFDGIPCTI